MVQPVRTEHKVIPDPNNELVEKARAIAPRIAERASAIGEELGTLETKAGKVYERVKIKNVTALELRFSHKNGNTGVSYKILPDELQDRFQFSEKDATAMTKAEDVQEVKSVQGGERYRVSKEILFLKMKIQQSKDSIARFTAESHRKQDLVKSNKSAIEAAIARAGQYRSLPNKGMNWDNAKKAERKADRIRRDSLNASSAIRALQKKIRESSDEVRTRERKVSDLQRALTKLSQKK